ncbi:MAG: uroporphyrinogen-III synthase [Rhodobacteraceae bacterium]|nr:uroporphyrinogen-III synthase [Paracoccaceae bacterium]
MPDSESKPRFMPKQTPLILLTRPVEGAQRFAGQLGAVDVLISPLMKIEPIGGRPPKAGGLVLTSVNGAQAAARLGMAAGLTAYCVGPQTAKAAQDAGFRVVAATGDAVALLALIKRKAPAENLVHIRGEHARGNIAARLNEAGIKCHETVAYRQTSMALSGPAQAALAASRPLIVPLFSPRSAALFAQAGPFAAPIVVVALSSAVAQEATRSGAFLRQGAMLGGMSIADAPDSEHMVYAVLSAYKRLIDAA